jgi:hypothetical protein
MITEFSFGRIVVDGKICNNDIKIIQGKLVPDWWRKSGHTVDVEDVQDALEAEPEILIIGKGKPGYMKLTDALRRYLKDHHIQLIDEPTADAVKMYNQLVNKGKRVSGGFHVGC